MENSAINSAIAVKTFGFLILVCSPGLILGQIRYSISEELEKGAFVGNIAQDLGLTVAQLSARQFRLTSEDGREYMMVNFENGILTVRERIDRDHFCGQANMCTIPFKIIMKNPSALHHGELEILDVNDNSPTLPESTVAVEIAEAIAPGVRFPLENAEDPDVGTNPVTAYTISSNDYFSLRTQVEGDVLSTELPLEKPLDREQRSSFRLILTATDAGTPPRSGSAEIIIKVVDMNDQKVYRSILRENVLPGTLVVKIKANDLDEGPNAELTYSFNKQTSLRIRELFSLDPQWTGDIHIEGVLDFEEAKSYSLNVQAVDHGSPAIIGRSKVLINVIDINDNAPEIKVSSKTFNVPEDAPPGTIISSINVIDRDSGENGQVQCKVSKTNSFRLEMWSENHYELITSEPMDRESDPEYEIAFIAWDLGPASLSSNTTIQVIISDVNDNPPQFVETLYNIYVMENKAPGASLMALTASDPDLDQNSYISYSLLNNVGYVFPVSTYLSINSMNGTIYALRSFDYEEFKSFQIHVQARDAGLTPLSSSVAVNVIILDQNDNAPIIVSPSGQSGSEAVVLLPQSSAQGYLVVKILATDADSGQNARLFYHMVKSTDPSLFNVGQNTGELTTSRVMMQRDTTTHTLVILVKDNGQPSLSSIPTIHISVLENITKTTTSSRISVASSKHFHDLNFYLIVIFTCTSILFLLMIILLIGIK
ncbi:LOW QUALITY PROTEIN: protocadherin alpha-C2-like [Narcine bancroftii]|uniref:LOW QUALITY PROTEIN: protocadherin alpha-C2-like n=1 Tax=Narcine bancroftii TaxID=1343680 RepID=UPI00383170A6